MELREYIKTVIVEIFEGVKESQEAIKNIGGVVNPFDTIRSGLISETEYFVGDKSFIEIEVGVTTSESKGSNKGLGVYIGNSGAGLHSKNNNENESVNKIKFSIPVKYPKNPRSEEYI
ncbi:hypothetical protein [Dysgonomonas mossii]|uniref:Uncharacterized protein n=1 Tax=Dysgonomonas mossii DSM 22836 TaxID=742767 RepID=F8X2E8_9BACT|nr:hypothetical protein [Dysgonomonas mossii]EGK05605.1 hypothetical protein HMPREF9456_02407 [Dysgonomonas mossii DSM 22836]MBS5907821.1 hypothetical protein [Dysgonomonas mossii]